MKEITKIACQIMPKPSFNKGWNRDSRS